MALAIKSFASSSFTNPGVVSKEGSYISILSSWFGFSRGLNNQAVIPFSGRFMSVMTSSSTVGKDAQHRELLDASYDAYGGVTVEMKEAMNCGDFILLLRASISQWRQEGKKGVWIKLPIELVNLVEAAVKEGFWFHHAEPKYLMLAYWIPQTPHSLPENASHRVGISAFVMNDKGEVLVVQEKNGKFKGIGVWKFLTGVVDEGEDISAAAIREVQEEAGIETEFVEVLAFRQSHKSFFGKSDLMFVCMLRPLSSDIQKQNSEIEAAQWMPLDEYAAQPFVQKHESFNRVARICLAKRDENYTGFSTVEATTAFSKKKSYLYVNNLYLEEQ